MPKSENNLLATYENDAFKQAIEYIFNLIFSTYGIIGPIISLKELKLDDSDLSEKLVISYGKIKPDFKVKYRVHIYASNFFGEDYLKPSSMPERPLKRYGELPIIFAGHGDFDDFVRESDSLIETNIDIIASCFFMLSRYEEVVMDTRDEHNRFPAKASLAYKEGFLGRPIVNEYIELLWRWIHSLMPNLERKPFWPQNEEFAICLTHDVDDLTRYSPLPPALSIGGAVLKQRNFRLALNIAWDYLGSLLHLKKDPFDYMLSLEQKYGFKPSFYFIAGGDSTFDASYSITKPKVMRLIQKIETEGCEVGLHGSYNSFNNLKRMASEKEQLNEIVSRKGYGCRQHYLRWKTPNTWQIQERLSLLYDTTLSFADHVGFRCGICLPFRPFDLIENRQLNIWELPLTIMEITLQNPNYQNLPPQEAYEEIIKLIETVKRFNGVFVLLWHNSSLAEWARWKDVFGKIMKYIREQSAFVSGGKEIIETWTKRLKGI